MATGTPGPCRRGDPPRAVGCSRPQTPHEWRGGGGGAGQAGCPRDPRWERLWPPGQGMGPLAPPSGSGGLSSWALLRGDGVVDSVSCLSPWAP